MSNSSAPSGNNLFTENSTNWAINHTITLPKNFVNNFRVGHLVAIANQYANAAPESAVAALGLQESSRVFLTTPEVGLGQLPKPQRFVWKPGK